MNKIQDMNIEDLEQLIEQKVLEFFGDPDSGLELKQQFKKELNRRLKNTSQQISHQEVSKRFDQN
jgi:hypothetical protein